MPTNQPKRLTDEELFEYQHIAEDDSVDTNNQIKFPVSAIVDMVKELILGREACKAQKEFGNKSTEFTYEKWVNAQKA